MEIRKIKLLLGLLAISLTVGAQNVEIPHRDFSLSFSNDKMELARGETTQMDINILKGEGYRKGKVKMGLSSSVPEGVKITFDPDNGNFDSTKVNVSANANALPGTYSLILSATLNYKTKGSILKLTIK
ncbi:MAG: hypothetical protein JSS79_17855 [Bacteroidetes bacterium]|nr:hypothetical protein [Bacteroidota bacterium]